jgi:hypothetical protein
MSIGQLKFCRGCATYASWSSGGLCPQCMTREAIEESNRIHRTVEPFNGQNFLIDLLGGICGIAFFIFCIYWLVS